MRRTKNKKVKYHPVPNRSSPTPIPQLDPLKKPEEGATGPTLVSVSSIVASSLGLNKIKTQSGPLPHESFFSFGSRDRGASLGYSTLSKPLGRGGTGGVDGGLSLGSGNKKKKEKLLVENAHNGSNSESRPSRDHSPHMVQAQANCISLGINRTEIGILIKSHQVSFSALLEKSHGRAMEVEIHLEIQEQSP
ncbi:Uncharacterized protein Fot_18658 [Forsythia ovata]|uniref:Uncharacterized protein n=1 Tax=Forsythia ovata TaxID=205694 RepID=A0ABD1VIT4_9LAMI